MMEYRCNACGDCASDRAAFDSCECKGTCVVTQSEYEATTCKPVDVGGIFVTNHSFNRDGRCARCGHLRGAREIINEPFNAAPTGGGEVETDEAFVARVSADIITLDYDTSALEHYADLARCGAIARSPGPHAGGGEDIASEIATSLCSEKFLVDLCALKARTDFPKADEWGYDENTTNNLGHVHGLIQEHVTKALSRRSASQATQEDSAQKDDLFDSLKLEHIVREWFSSPMCKDLPQSVIDGFVDVLRFRLRRAAPPGSHSRDGGSNG